VEYRSADGQRDRLEDLAEELLRLHVAIIVSQTTPATAAATRATTKIPIVMLAVADPIGAGFIESLGRLGGNVTGFSLMLVDIGAKRLEILKTLLPRVARVAVFWNPTNPAQKLMLPPTETAAQKLGLSIQLAVVTTGEDLDGAFETVIRGRAEAIMVFEDSITVSNRKRIVALSDRYRLPAMYGARAFLDEGGLIGYSPNDPEQYRRAGVHINKILKGADPREVPVEQPSKVDLIVNLKTAKALGLTIPPSLLLRADQVIE
jgi:putative ABC transport system substrate-binding protein